MPVPPLFIGVVSHEGSRFAVSQGPTGLAAQVAAQLPGTSVVVMTSDLLPDPSPLVSSEAVQASLTAEMRLEGAWARFLGRPRSWRWWGVRASRWARRSWQRVRPPSPAMVRRLLNIELAHLDLMRQGLASGAPWVLILEDDAFTSDISDLSAGLAGIFALGDGPEYVNLSESFTPAELGISHLLREVDDVTWAGASTRSVLASALPVTNTVCAIAYSSAFLARLAPALEALPVSPVVPIDWKLNQALMDLHTAGELPSGSCWLVEPAPIRQMSMQPAGILPS